MPTKISPEGFKIIYWDTMEELVSTVCERPGIFAGTNHLDKVDAFFHGYEMGLWDAARRDDADAHWSGELVVFSIWLCEECFFDTYGDAVGSVAGWSHFLAWLANDDAEAFVFMPILYHEFTVALQEAGGSRALRDHLDAVKLTSEGSWALQEENVQYGEDDVAERSAKRKAARDARVSEQRVPLRAVMQKAVQAAAQGVDRPLATHVAAMRASREAQKKRAAGLLRQAATPQ